MKTSMFVALLGLAMAVPAAAQQTPPARPTASLAVPPDAPPPKNNPPGPYEVTIEANPGLPTHTIYRPSDLSKLSASHALPIVSWGNGACANAGTLFQVFLKQVASHGYLAISIGPKDAPLPAFARGAAGQAAQAAGNAAQAPLPQSRDEQLIDAIDWAIKENAREGSPYYQRLNPDRIAVMGQSCGGLQTIAVSGDPRIKTSVLWNSGTFAEGVDSMATRLSNATKADLAKLHAPIAYFIGGPSDIAYAQAEDDFKRITTVPVFKANLNVGHGGTFRHPGAGWYGEVGVAWLDWQLKGDEAAGKYFVGKDCVLCVNPLWQVEKKGIDCDDGCLRAHAQRYVEALVKRTPHALKVTNDVRYTENGAVAKLGEGLWKSATGLGSYRYIVSDVSTQQTMFVGIVEEEEGPAIATIRLQVDGDAITQIEHVVARKGSHALFAPQALQQPHASLTTPVKQRLPREKLIAIAETYFDGIEQHTSKIIESSTSCQRIENGVQTTGVAGRTSKHCAESADVLTYIKSVDDRRYPIVDVAHGVVVATILFDIEGETNEANAARISSDPAIAARLRQPRTLLLTEWFKIDDDKIQYIEAVMQNLPRGSKSGWEDVPR